MPELPEIELLSRGLNQRLKGQSVTAVKTRQPRMLNLPLEQYEGALQEAGPLQRVLRQGKFSVLQFKPGSVWLHLGLGGRVRLTPSDKIDFNPQYELKFNGGDSVTVEHAFMSNAHWLNTEQSKTRLDSKVPDALDESFTVEALGKLLKRRARTNVKALLMDQKQLQGIGNAYSDEILHIAAIDPRRNAGSLGDEEVTTLHQTMREVLQRAIKEGGEPNYLGLDGEEGGLRLLVHRQTECASCGGPVTKQQVGGRSAHFCESCQH